MTAVPPAPPPAPELAHHSFAIGASPHDGLSFGEVLSDLLGAGSAGGWVRGRDFGGGTMPSSVDVFDGHGFFIGATPSERPSAAGSAPTVAQVSDQAGRQVLSAGWPILGGPDEDSPGSAPAIGAAGPGPEPPGEAAPEPGETPLTSTIMAAGDSVAEPPSSGAGCTPPASPTSRFRTAASRPPFASPDRAARSRSDPAACAGVKVTLEEAGEASAVTVVGLGLPAGDLQALRSAVAGLLARHGLMLGDLRVGRRARPDNRSGTRE